MLVIRVDMMDTLLVYILFYLFFAIAILWAASMYMLKEQRMMVFMPFVFVGIASAFSAGFIFFGLFLDAVWFFVEMIHIAFLLSVALVLVYCDRL